jgi:hypothetical protein
MHIEDELRKALRAEDPGAAFTQRILAHAREERTRETTPARPFVTVTSAEGPHTYAPMREDVAVRGVERQKATWREGWTVRRFVAVVAASVALAAASAQLVQHQRYVAAGERARAQVMTALRLTSEKLNLVHDKIAAASEEEAR